MIPMLACHYMQGDPNGRSILPPPSLHLVSFFGTALLFYFSKFLHLKFIHLKFIHLKFIHLKCRDLKFI